MSHVIIYVLSKDGGCHIVGGVLGRDEMCLLTEAICIRDEAVFAADSYWGTFTDVAAFCVLGAIAHLLEVLSVCIQKTFTNSAQRL